MNKILCVGFLFLASCTGDFFGSKVQSKYVTRGGGAQCALVSDWNLSKISQRETNCVCVAAPRSDEEFQQVTETFVSQKFVVVRQIYLVESRVCDPNLTDKQLEQMR